MSFQPSLFLDIHDHHSFPDNIYDVNNWWGYLCVFFSFIPRKDLIITIYLSTNIYYLHFPVESFYCDRTIHTVKHKMLDKLALS